MSHFLVYVDLTSESKISEKLNFKSSYYGIFQILFTNFALACCASTAMLLGAFMRPPPAWYPTPGERGE